MPDSSRLGLLLLELIPDLVHLLSASTLDGESIAPLRDGAEVFVGVLATVSSGLLDENNSPM